MYLYSTSRSQRSTAEPHPLRTVATSPTRRLRTTSRHSRGTPGEREDGRPSDRPRPGNRPGRRAPSTNSSRPRGVCSASCTPSPRTAGPRPPAEVHAGPRSQRGPATPPTPRSAMHSTEPEAVNARAWTTYGTHHAPVTAVYDAEAPSYRFEGHRGDGSAGPRGPAVRTAHDPAPPRTLPVRSVVRATSDPRRYRAARAMPAPGRSRAARSRPRRQHVRGLPAQPPSAYLTNQCRAGCPPGMDR